MLAGCSSTLLSPRHRLRSEASAAAAQFQACHIPTMSTQRLDIPCSFGRKDTSRSQPVARTVGLSIEKPVEAKTGAGGCSLRQSIKLPPTATEGRRENRDEVWEKRKRLAADVSYDEESYSNRVKRKRGGDGKSDGLPGDLSLGQLNSEEFWFHPGFSVPQPISQIGDIHTSCTGEEGRVCFVPTDVIGPPLPPLSSVPWFESVVTEITGLGEGRNVGTIKGQEKEGSGSSSTSSDSHGLVLGLGGSDNPVEHEIGNGSSSHNPSGTAAGVGVAGLNGENNNHIEHDCIELVSLLVACVDQIGFKNAAAVNQCLARLGELASPRGSSPLHRLVAYFTEALAIRVARIWPHFFHIATPRELDRVGDESGGTALRLLNQVSPIPKFIHFTSNEILLRAFQGKDRVHIIDFDIKQGLQWPSLFQSLASRPNPPSHVRITGIGESKQELVETGDRLAGFAEALNLQFEFHPVVDRLEDVRLWMLHVNREKECVAVNCVFQLHKMLYDTTGGMLRDFLGLIRSTRAEVVIISEQEAAHNEVDLHARLSNSLKYYSAIFDAMDSSLPLESTVRMKIEEMFGREIRNMIACEGEERMERHETLAKWKQLMEEAGFGCMETTEREVVQGEMMLRMYCSEGYGVEKNGGGLTLSWSDQPLYTVSAWCPVDVAGSSHTA